MTKKNSGKNKLHIDKKNVSKNNEIDTNIFSSVLKSTPSIKIDSFSKEGGDVVFSVPQKDIINEMDFNTNFIVKTKFFANFAGELLVRQNIDRFIDLLINIDAEEYDKLVCGFNHRNFGMFVCEKSKTLKFEFHISLIQDILTEDINGIIKFKP